MITFRLPQGVSAAELPAPFDAAAKRVRATHVVLPAVLGITQGVSEFLKSFYMARTGIELEHKEKVEI